MCCLFKGEFQCNDLGANWKEEIQNSPLGLWKRMLVANAVHFFSDSEYLQRAHWRIKFKYVLGYLTKRGDFTLNNNQAWLLSDETTQNIRTIYLKAETGHSIGLQLTNVDSISAACFHLCKHMALSKMKLKQSYYEGQHTGSLEKSR